MIDEKLSRQAMELTAKMTQLIDASVAPGKDHPFPDLALTPREVNILILLGKREELIMTELAAMTDSPLSTATRVVDRLVKKNLVQRERSERDRRIVVIRASEEGKLFYRSMQQQHLAASYKMLQALTEEEREVYVGLVGKLAAVLRR
ncbi:MarR family transcriptional regulator [Geobacter sp. FeAm09]|uniref:MarR family winged helix-turn-helix transcriptional regulator n=1 Tax=Geobacter sp. FeAm09 TaxID=2597769 RepID=UPI0011EF8F85|nr:MarR family transcriptional regulator [Geobacter sp. FeAm09]QEM70007.1 MarR family transcriptional regulator [Geobacter sp. FeAm09]